MKYIRFYATTGFCGGDAEEYWAFKKEINEKEMDEYTDELIHTNGDSYFDLERFGYAPDRDEYDSEEEYEEALAEAEEWYWEDCSGGWEYVSKEEWEENNGQVWED